ncbi:YaaC family protein [Actinomadura sp. 3N508]|uniref:YaaC family protein n=1 Tax=Actinomadura sp. 3N508 TaxID=3375153 RepID=UPI0037887FD8
MNAETAKTWERLRATRSAPPAPARSTPERRRTYCTSLEQAQQMFHAAEQAGPETQPLHIFYGLSQAGRAIAAASASPLAAGDGWQLLGHGIRARSLDGPLPEIEVRSDASGNAGSFVRLSEILQSPLLPKTADVRLRELWDCIPANHEWPIGGDEASRRMPLRVDHRSLAPDPQPQWSVGVAGLPAWLTQAVQPRERLEEYMGAFPYAQGWELAGPRSDGSPVFQPGGEWPGSAIYLYWNLPDQDKRDFQDAQAEFRDFLMARTRGYKGDRWFFPAVAGADAIHPLMAWWAVLHALSMLARYQPDQWVQHIDVDVDGSRAVAIEQLLREALTTVPQLIAETIEHVAKPTT